MPTGDFFELKCTGGELRAALALNAREALGGHLETLLAQRLAEGGPHGRHWGSDRADQLHSGERHGGAASQDSSYDASALAWSVQLLAVSA